MKRLVISISILLLVNLSIMPIFAYDRILPPIDRARLSRIKHKVTIEWTQYVPAHVIVFKTSAVRMGTGSGCNIGPTYNNEYYGPYCQIVAEKYVIKHGIVSIPDRAYKRGDRYYIIQYVFSTHNVPYGPFIPKT